MDELKKLIESTAAETRRHSDEVAAQMRKHLDQVIADTRQHSEDLAAQTRQHSDEVATETRRHFEVVAERLESKIDMVAEGVTAANERIDRLDKKVDGLAAEMANEFDDVRSMIKFSHHELDRRVRSLEEVVSDLQARVERLESSTH